MSRPIKPAVIGAYQSPGTYPRVQLKPCRPSCCRTPYMCAKGRACACHTGEDTE